MGKTASTTVIEAKWTGACPAGIKVGDMILPDGRKTMEHVGRHAAPALPKQ